MLGGERLVGRTDELAPKPTYGETALASFEKPFLQVNQLHDYLAPGLSSEETRKMTSDRLAVIDETLADPRQGFGQKSTNFVSSMVGSIIPTLPFGFVGGIAVKGAVAAVGFGARAAAVELGETGINAYLGTQVPLATLAEGAASHYLPKLSAAQIASGVAIGYGDYKGFVIPEHFAEHYNAVNNTLDSRHAIEDWASDNYGFLLPAGGLAAGYIAFKGVRGAILHRNANITAKAAEKELNRLHLEHAEVLKANEIKAGESRAAREAKVSELQSHLQQAEESGAISPEMHQWYLDHLENPEHPSTHEGALNILKSIQTPYDRFTGKVWMEILGREDIQNLKGALYDQGITNFSKEENQLLSTFVVHSALGKNVANLRHQPELVTAIQGMAHNLGLKIAKHSDDLKEFDLTIQKLLPKGLLKRQIHSQNNIYQHLKKIGIHHTQEVPYHVPKGVQAKLKLVKKIQDTERKIKHYTAKLTKYLETKSTYESQIKQLGDRLHWLKSTKPKGGFDQRASLKQKIHDVEFEIKGLADKLNSLGKTDAQERLATLAERKKRLESLQKETKLMHPAEELMHLKDKLMPDGKLIDNYKNKSAYHRLQDLSQVWPEARVVLDRINMEFVNAKQKALNEILKKFTNMVDSGIADIANPDSVKRYLSSRIEKAVPFARTINDDRIGLEHSTLEVAEKEGHSPDLMFNEEAQTEAAKTDYEYAAETYKKSEAKYKQFTENSKALTDLINCQLGAE